MEWTIWSAWTDCSVKCGIGVHKRFRNCSLPNRCIGSYVQVSKCQGHILFCENEEINELIQSGSKIIKSVSKNSVIYFYELVYSQLSALLFN